MDDSDVEILNVVAGDGDSTTTTASATKHTGGRLWGALAVLVLVAGVLYGVNKSTSDDEALPADTPETEQAQQPGADEPSLATREEAVITLAEGSGFGADIGWDLLQSDNATVSHLNLANGTRTKYTERFRFLASAGRHALAVDTRSSGDLFAVKLDSNGLTSQILDNGQYGEYWSGLQGVVIEGSTVWLTAHDPDGTDVMWEHWNLASESPKLLWEQLRPPRVSGQHPNIVSTISGGVFAIGPNEGSVRLADGALLAVTSSHILVENCLDPFDCSRTWLRRGPYTVDEVLVVPPDAQSFFATSSPDGRYLVLFTFDGNGRQLVVWDTISGSEIEGFNPGNIDTALAFSPDSKFLAGSAVGGGLLVLNLQTRETATFPDFRYSDSLVFIPSQG